MTFRVWPPDAVERIESWGPLCEIDFGVKDAEIGRERDHIIIFIEVDIRGVKSIAAGREINGIQRSFIADGNTAAIGIAQPVERFFHEVLH